MPQAISAQQTLEQSQAVIDRLQPLTLAFATADKGLREHLVAAWFDKLQALRELGRHAEAAQAAEALAQHLEGAEPADWHWAARALYLKGMAQARNQDFDEALTTWRALELRFEKTESAPVREWLARAGLEIIELTVYRGATFARVDMVREADRLEQQFGKDEWPATQVLVGKIRLRKGELLDDLEYHQQALETFEQLSQDLQRSSLDDVREVAADAALARVRLLAKKDWPAASAAMEELLQTYAGSQHTGIRQTLALAHVDRIYWRHYSRREAPEGSNWPDQTIAACEQMEAQFSDTDSVTEVRSLGKCLQAHAEALRQRAEIAEEAEEVEEAEYSPQTADWRAQADAVSAQHWQRHALHADVKVRQTALVAWMNSLEEKAPQQAMPAYEDVLQKLGEDQAPELQEQLAQAWFNLANAQHRLRQSPQALTTLQASHKRFAHSQDAYVQLLRGRAMRFAARIHHENGRHDEALALLGELERQPEQQGLTEPQRDAWQRLQVLSMQLQAEIWGAQAPPRHDQQSGVDESGARITVTPTNAELQQAAVVQRMLQRFGDASDQQTQKLLLNSLFDLAVAQREHLHLEAAVQSYELLLQRFAKTIEDSRIASAYLNLAYLQMQLLERNEDAIKTYDALLELIARSTRPVDRDTVAKANASRLTCLNRLQREGVNVSYGAQYEDLPLAQRDAVQALVDKGRELQDAEQYRAAVEQYDQVLAAHGESLHPALRAICLDALVSKGFCLGRLEQREAAIAVNNEVIARYGDDMNMSSDKDVALAFSNKAAQLYKLGRYAEEIEAYDEIIRRWQGNSVGYLRMRVARAMWSKGQTLSEIDPPQAEAVYKQTRDRYLDAPEADVRLEGVKAAVSLGALMRKQGRYAEVIPMQEKHLQMLAGETAPGFAEQVNWLRIQLARTYGQTGQIEQQRAMYGELMSRPKGELSSKLLNTVLTEYQACKPEAGLQVLRKAVTSLFSRKK